MNKNNLYCGNCGKHGHNYRKCLAPIISLGIILFKRDKNKLNYLLIQRKDTLGFVEFMRGKYNLDNVSYIYKLFDIMTRDERNKIINNNFDYLWNKLWMNNNKYYYNEYDNSKYKFNQLRNGIYNKNNLVTLDIINKNVKFKWENPEWGFPKGRRNLRESDIKCAVREFEEETGINRDEYELIPSIIPIEELFLGSNNIRYKHIYYIARAKENIKNVFIDKNNINQVSEISNIKWFSFINGLRNIRNYNIEKKNVLEKVNSILSKKKI